MPTIMLHCTWALLSTGGVWVYMSLTCCCCGCRCSYNSCICCLPSAPGFLHGHVRACVGRACMCPLVPCFFALLLGVSKPFLAAAAAWRWQPQQGCAQAHT